MKKSLVIQKTYRSFAIRNEKNIKKIDYKEKTEKLAMFAKALAHPTRIAILRHHENQSCYFTGDLVDILPLAQSTISQHLKELKNAGLIQGELKPPIIKYCIRGGGLIIS